jgi:hypothetical protein
VENFQDAFLIIVFKRGKNEEKFKKYTTKSINGGFLNQDFS